MNNLIWNFIEINIIVLILGGVFYLIRRRISYPQQRFFLVGTPFLAIGAVVLKSSFEVVNYTIPLVELSPITVGQPTVPISEGILSFFTLGNIYWLGVGIASLMVIIKLARVGYFFVKNPSEKTEEFKVYNVSGRPSFSFFNRIQIEPELTEEQQEIVFEHEKIHVRKRHSLDLLILEFFNVIFWFNPMLIALKQELINLHEFEVDQDMYKTHQVKYMEFLVSHAFQLQHTPFAFAHPFFNHLTLKKRIIHMKKKQKQKTWLLALVPMVVLLATVVQCTKPKVEEAAETAPIEEVVYKEVEENPVFQGGDEAMINYIVENVEYPAEAKAEEAEGTVYVGFVVSSTGKVKDCRVRREVNPYLDAEALRVVEQMPDWTPGKVDGKEVAVEYTLPISFRLE